MKCRKVLSMLRFFFPNKNESFELYAQHVFMLYLPFRRELGNPKWVIHPVTPINQEKQVL